MFSDECRFNLCHANRHKKSLSPSGRAFCRCVNDLAAALHAEWANLPAPFIQRFVNRMSRRITAYQDNFPQTTAPWTTPLQIPPGTIAPKTIAPQNNSPRDNTPCTISTKANSPQTRAPGLLSPGQLPPPQTTATCQFPPGQLPPGQFPLGESPHLPRNFFCFCFGTRSLSAFSVRLWIHFQGRVKLKLEYIR